ncbi:hydantoinase B/oxoprolinase family protein [Magnetococcales bacterium HHB-1]
MNRSINALKAKGQWRFAVDRGGTFTDIVAQTPTGEVRAKKLLSESGDYEDAAIEGMRRFLQQEPNTVLPEKEIAWIRLGTTVATNALLERKGAVTGLLITKGFRDLLEIGSQRRSDLFALAVRKPEKIYQAVEEVEERIQADGVIITPLNMSATQEALKRLYDQGVKSLAIVFLHAWKNPQHEKAVLAQAEKIGFSHISVSHQVLPVIQMVGRGRTTLVDAYLTPVLHAYINRVKRWTGNIPIHFISSSGDLLAANQFSGKDAVLSGPAGGVLATALLQKKGKRRAVIGFDMGGTSTDVCRYDGQFERVMAAEIAGVSYQAAMLHVKTVAAGGGSLLHFDGQALKVGPDSAGADPGPACYGLGGPLALTDANLVLGRLIGQFFPKIFGPQRNQPLDLAAARQGFSRLCEKIAQKTGKCYTIEALAYGFIQVANEAMGEPIKALSMARGYDLRHHNLICFGGAGAQHACGIAHILEMAAVKIHPLAGVFSAYGIARTPLRQSFVQTVLKTLSASVLEKLHQRSQTLIEKLEEKLNHHAKSSDKAQFHHHIEVDLRVLGADAALTVMFSPREGVLRNRFEQQHQRRYGFSSGEVALEILNLRIEVTQRVTDPFSIATESRCTNKEPQSLMVMDVWFSGEHSEKTPLYRREDLYEGLKMQGPLIILDDYSTIVVEPCFTLTVEAEQILSLHSNQHKTAPLSTVRDPITLALFNRRFMGIAEQMGEVLARTAHSINMKERLDFSCALFDAKGYLIANAPHVPVHLGAMGETVRALIKDKGAVMRMGDAFVSNDPMQGGSHLPDITVITPLFLQGKLAFFAASRGHHADIGGVVPGSMPPFARSLKEEGVVLSHLLVVHEGIFYREQVEKALLEGDYPARNLSERLSDLQAQIAANNQGIVALTHLVQQYGLDVVSAYMEHMRFHAAEAMTNALSSILGSRQIWRGRFQDTLDDGYPIAVEITIDRDDQDRVRAVIDFSGSAKMHPENLNAPVAVTRAAVLYVFRTLIHEDIPLNDGCFIPLKVKIPPGSILSPESGAAVSGGNVETSQRVVDVLYGALGVAAASQGTMNNLLFGGLDKESQQYYETIAGGVGAVDGEDGADAVQVHMTNTRITDVEVFESRFPGVRLEQFSIRRNSGGQGRWRGGDGVVRTLLFLKPQQVTLLSERREKAPFGLEGGEEGARGENWHILKNQQRKTLPGRFQGVIDAGEKIEIHTPGGGGFGSCERS